MSSAEGRLRPACLVVGAGLIGTSIAMVLDNLGWAIKLEDIDATALAHSYLRLSSNAQAAQQEEARPDLVVIAVPPLQMARTVRQHLELHPTATVTDVCSVKGPVIAGVKGHPGWSRYVPSHPMAGSHVRGSAGARADLFQGMSWAVVAQATDAATRDVLQLVNLCGAVPVLIDSTTHDRAVARVSHLPHLLSGMLAEHLSSSPEVYRELIGRGALDMTRIAQADSGLWKQIMHENSTALREEVEAFIRLLERVMEPVEPEVVEHFLDQSMSSAKSLHERQQAKLKAAGHAPSTSAAVTHAVGDR